MLNRVVARGGPMARVLMVLHYNHPVFCTEADIELWNGMCPDRAAELRLIELMERDPARAVRPAMRAACRRTQ